MAPGPSVHPRRLEHVAAERLGEAAVGLAELAGHEVDHRLGEGEGLGTLEDLLFVEVVLHHELGEIADDLRGRGDLDEVAEESVGGTVGALDRLPALEQPEGLGLEPQVGVLAAGDLVLVEIRRVAGQAGLEGGVEAARHLQ